jgi:hypothetical protein
MLTLFVGDNDQSIATAALQMDSNAFLINQNNCHNYLQGTGYTSLADLSDENNFAKVLQAADIIIYSPPPNDVWSDNNKIKFKSKSLKELTEYHLNFFSFDKSKKMLNFTSVYSPTLNFEINKRLTENKNAWLIGGSITSGVGVAEDEKYSSILSRKLGMPLVDLSMPRTSILWCVDQLLRSQVQKDDLILLELPPCCRFPYYKYTGEVFHASLSAIEGQMVDHRIISTGFLSDPHLIVLSLVSILQLINFCNKIGAKLIILGICCDLELCQELKDFPEYLHLQNYWGYNKYLDFDNQKNDHQGGHPGPKSHQYYAEKILQFIQSNPL